MKVLLIPSRYLPNRGGVETVVAQISEHFVQCGHSVSIVTNRYPRALPKRELINGFPILRLHFLYPKLTYLKIGRFNLWLAGLFYFPLTLFQLAWRLYTYKPDVVNLHYLGAPSLFIWLLHRLFGFSLVVSLHGGDVDGEPHRSRFNLWLFRAVLACADAVTTCSDVLLEQTLKLAPEVKPRAQTIHNGVDAELFAAAEPYHHPRPYILAVGQLVPHKGFDTVISAFARAQPTLKAIDLLIAGDGPERQSLDAQVVKEKMSEQIHFLGVMTHEEVASLMRGAAVIVIPSRREPFGIVGLEALASGRPVIATRVGGLIEALEAAEVHWIRANDPTSLQQGLCQLLIDPIPVNYRNQAIAAERGLKKLGESYLRLFEQTVQGKFQAT